MPLTITVTSNHSWRLGLLDNSAKIQVGSRYKLAHFSVEDAVILSHALALGQMRYKVIAQPVGFCLLILNKILFKKCNASFSRKIVGICCGSCVKRSSEEEASRRE